MTWAEVVKDWISALAPLLAVPIAGLLCDLILRARQWLNAHSALLDKQTTIQDRAIMEQQIAAAINVGVNQLIPAIQAKGWADPEVRKEILDIAVPYLVQRFPERAQSISQGAGAVSSDDTAHALIETVGARLGNALAPLAVQAGADAQTAATGQGPRAAAVLLAILLAASTLTACTPAQDAKVSMVLGTVPGQLFCTLQKAGGGQIITAIVQAEITGAAPLAGPVAVLATNATKAAVDMACDKAAVAAGAVVGVPSSPPPPGVTPSVTAIVPPAGIPLAKVGA